MKCCRVKFHSDLKVVCFALLACCLSPFSPMPTFSTPFSVCLPSAAWGAATYNGIKSNTTVWQQLWASFKYQNSWHNLREFCSLSSSPSLSPPLSLSLLTLIFGVFQLCGGLRKRPQVVAKWQLEDEGKAAHDRERERAQAKHHK